MVLALESRIHERSTENSFATKESHQSQMCIRVSLNRDLERPLCEALKILDCLGVLRMLTFLTFGAVMSILCHCMLEVCDLFFHFDFTGVTTKKFLEDSEDTLVLDFKTCL